MAAESAHDGSRFQIPKADDLVATTREQVLAIGQKLHAPRPPALTLEPANFPTRGCLPEVDCSICVTRTRSQALAVR